MTSITSRVPQILRDRYRTHWHKLKLIARADAVKRIRWRLQRRPPPRAVDGSMRIHLGCGGADYPGFVNVDLAPHPHVHYLQPIDDLRIFAADSADLIYASHCLEHFPFRKVPRVLREWHRVLKPGGILRLSVPDFDAVVDAYLAAARELRVVHQAVVGGQNSKHNFHYVLFNAVTLTEQLKDCGFSDIQPWTPQAEALNIPKDFSASTFVVGDRRIPISLNIQGTK